MVGSPFGSLLPHWSAGLASVLINTSYACHPSRPTSPILSSLADCPPDLGRFPRRLRKAPPPRHGTAAPECLRDTFRVRLGLPAGHIAAGAAVHTFGDYLVFHPHLHVFAADGLWESAIDLPPPPDPPFDIETFEPIEPPWQAIREWIPANDDAAPDFDLFDQRLELRLRPPWAGVAPREDGSILVLDLD